MRREVDFVREGRASVADYKLQRVIIKAESEITTTINNERQ